MMHAPTPAEPGRIEPLSVLPVFLKLKGRTALIVGGSAGAAWKAELVAASGASLRLVADEPSEELRALAAALGTAIETRGWQDADLVGAAIAIADVETEEEGARFAVAARAAGVPVNVVDKPGLCDFQFGGIVNRSPLVIGISTDGAAPVFGQAVRLRIETVIPRGFRRWAEAARDWRGAIQALALSFRARRQVWELFSRLALDRPDKPPTESDRAAIVALARRAAEQPPVGSVVLVGAGPGDPELLTLKAVRALQSADVILHDDLVSEAVLDFARREARRIVVGKRGGRESCKQTEINRLMVALAGEGKRVVRLKGGDPMVFGRAGEEIAACRAAGITVEIVPGVTAALGAAARVQASLTHRDHARRLQFITAHARDGRIPEDIDWAALADPAATTAVYMGKAVAAGLSARMLAAGAAPDLPVIIVENATREDERVIATTLAGLPGVFEREVIDGPCLMLAGHALSEAALPPALADGTVANAASASLRLPKSSSMDTPVGV